MRHYLALLSVISLALAGTAGAYVQQGDTELDLLGGWTSESGASDGFDADSLSVEASLGYFISDNVQLGVGGFGKWTEFSGVTASFDTGNEGVTGVFQDTDLKINTYGVGGKIKYHFSPANAWVPYIGAQGFWANAKIDASGSVGIALDGVLVPGEGASIDTSNDASGFLFGPIVGIRGEINEFNDFFVEGQYHLWTGDIGDFFDNGFGIFFGIIHQFQ